MMRSNKVRGSKKKTFYVCNPLTYEQIALPRHGKPCGRGSYALMAAAYSGDDCLEYRVLCLIPSGGYDDVEEYSQLLMLPSETGEWWSWATSFRREDMTWGGPLKFFFNGSLYWDCFDAHILVWHLDSNGKESGYKVIETPRDVLTRCLWKSEDKLHCCCIEAEDLFPDYWTLCDNDAGDDQELRWKEEDCDPLRNVTDDIRSFFRTAKAEKISRSKSKIIAYAPESETFIIYKSDYGHAFAYQWTNRSLVYLGHSGARSVQQCWVLPFTHCSLPIQTAKPALCPDQNGRADGESETGSERKKVRVRRNKRTPRCPDFRRVED